MYAFDCKESHKTIFYNGDYSGMKIFDNETEQEIPFPISRDDFLRFAKQTVGDEIISLIEDNLY